MPYGKKTEQNTDGTDDNNHHFAIHGHSASAI
jgi:hypothetical protein